MVTHTKIKPLVRIITAAVIAAAVALLSSATETSTKPVAAQNNCPYAQTGLASTDLGFTIAREMRWSTGDVNEFRMEGPYVGNLQITAIGETLLSESDGFGCEQGLESLSLDKGPSTIHLYAARCDPEERAIRFRIVMAEQCDRNGEMIQSVSTFKWLAGDEGTEDATEADPLRTDSTPNTETPGDSTAIQGPAPVYVRREAAQLGVDDPPCNMTGALIQGLALRSAGASEEGPRHLKMAWTTELEQKPNSFCIEIEHKYPETIPDGVGDFQTDGYALSWMQSFLSRGRYFEYGARLGGAEFAGMYPGGKYLITIRATMNNGDFGPGTTIEATTNPVETLGSVVGAAATESELAPGTVILRWQAAAGHPRSLYPTDGITVAIEWKKAGENYSPERMQDPTPNFGFQVVPRPLYWGQPSIWYRSIVHLETGTSYTFRLTPKQPNFGDGPPVEITHRTVALKASTMTRHAVKMANYIIKRLRLSSSDSPR